MEEIIDNERPREFIKKQKVTQLKEAIKKDIQWGLQKKQRASRKTFVK